MVPVESSEEMMVVPGGVALVLLSGLQTAAMALVTQPALDREWNAASVWDHSSRVVVVDTAVSLVTWSGMEEVIRLDAEGSHWYIGHPEGGCGEIAAVRTRMREKVKDAW